jgi:UDP-N-acetylmuramoyl-tripeptide--D-alanyl-D-alanine ligase
MCIKCVGDYGNIRAGYLTLAASACAWALGIDIKLIKQGLEKTQAEKGRLNIIRKSNLTLIDDSYNASPSSSKYALEVLNSFTGKKIAVYCHLR